MSHTDIYIYIEIAFLWFTGQIINIIFHEGLIEALSNKTQSKEV